MRERESECLCMGWSECSSGCVRWLLESSREGSVVSRVLLHSVDSVAGDVWRQRVMSMLAGSRVIQTADYWVSGGVVLAFETAKDIILAACDNSERDDRVQEDRRRVVNELKRLGREMARCNRLEELVLLVVDSLEPVALKDRKGDVGMDELEDKVHLIVEKYRRAPEILERNRRLEVQVKNLEMLVMMHEAERKKKEEPLPETASTSPGALEQALTEKQLLEDRILELETFFASNQGQTIMELEKKLAESRLRVAELEADNDELQMQIEDLTS